MVKRSDSHGVMRRIRQTIVLTILETEQVLHDFILKSSFNRPRKKVIEIPIFLL